MRLLAIVLIAGALVTLIVRLTAEPEPLASVRPEPTLVAVGQSAPRFELKDTEGQTVSVGGPSSGWTLITFYRQAMTPW